MSGQTDRRQFLQQSALAGLGFWVAGGVSGAEEKASEKLNIACIGVGGKGGSDTDHAGVVGNVVALCDADEGTLDGKARKFPKAKKYTDFRKLLEEMEKNIDAVTVSTPDHTHAPAAIMAMKMGKHVYCQKPLTHSVFEARKMREAAREYKVCTQMGNQGTATTGLREAVEIVQSGALGKVKEVHVWTDRPREFWKQAPKVTKRPKSEKPPKQLKWDLWLGPAPYRDYAPGYHPMAWRGWWDFGTGALGDMACHTCNMPYMALKLGLPSSIVAESGEVNPETYPEWATIVFEFPARGDLPAVKLTWYEGSKGGKRTFPPKELLHGLKFTNSGSLLVGDKGTLYSRGDYGDHRVLLPEKDFKDYEKPKARLSRHTGDSDLNQKREWVAAIKKKDPKVALSNFDYAAMLTESILLGNVAIRAGEKLEYDGKEGKITNVKDANKYLSRKYREGWKL
jgi:predicted dehydrogenase